MARRSFQVSTFTPTATADATNLANTTYMAIGAANATSGVSVIEIYMGGQAAASSLNFMNFARDSTLGATLTALASPNSDGPLNTLTPAAQVGGLTFVGATTNPQRSNTTTSAKLNLAFNAFGGIVRWVAAPGEEWGIIGVTVSVSESSLSCNTGTTAGAMGAHIIYETM